MQSNYDDIYHLKHKDIILITFKYLADGLERGNIKIININTDKITFLPFPLKQLDDDILKEWLVIRSYQIGRAHV